MFTKCQLLNMNCDKKYSSVKWIKNVENIDDSKLYILYATKNASFASGREFIPLPHDKILTNDDYVKYNIMK